MKLPLNLLIFGLLSLNVFAQDWYFTGIRIYTDTGTINKHGTKYGYVWIRNDSQKSAHQKAFKEESKKTYKSVDITYKSSKSYQFVAVYRISAMESQWKGNQKKKISYYKFYAGKTMESIEKKLASDNKLHKYVGTERVELIDLAKKKAELNQQNNNPAAGRSIQ